MRNNGKRLSQVSPIGSGAEQIINTGLIASHSGAVALSASQVDAERVRQEIAAKLERDKQDLAVRQTDLLVTIQTAENQAARDILSMTGPAIGPAPEHPTIPLGPAAVTAATAATVQPASPAHPTTTATYGGSSSSGSIGPPPDGENWHRDGPMIDVPFIGPPPSRGLLRSVKNVETIDNRTIANDRPWCRIRTTTGGVSKLPDFDRRIPTGEQKTGAATTNARSTCAIGIPCRRTIAIMPRPPFSFIALPVFCSAHIAPHVVA